MYTQDKNKRITLRLNEEQFNFVRVQADILGVSPSDFLRMVINSSLSVYKAKLNQIENGLSKIDLGGQQGRENDKANSHDLV